MSNQPTKEEWIAALRSGEYKQHRGTLYAGDRFENATSFCCIGVYAKLAGLHTPRYGIGTGDVQRVCPLVNELNNALEKTVGHGLISMNDQLEYDFNQIADALEQL